MSTKDMLLKTICKNSTEKNKGVKKRRRYAPTFVELVVHGSSYVVPWRSAEKFLFRVLPPIAFGLKGHLVLIFALIYFISVLLCCFD